MRIHEEQFITYLLDTKDYTIFQKYNIDENYFFSYKEVIQYILDFYAQYHTVPSYNTVYARFNIGRTEVDNIDAVVANIKETYVYNKMKPVLETVSKEMESGNSIIGVNTLRQNIQQISKDIETASFYNWAKQTDVRYEDYIRRAQNPQSIIIPTGIPTLDKLFDGGLQREDLFVITARLGQGKSWLSNLFLLNAWREGYNVLLFSLEMEKMTIGYRLDTICGHFSNSQLMTGKLSNEVLYKEYLDELKQHDNFFYILTLDENKGMPYTIDDIGQIIDTVKPDVVGIDQLSLIASNRKYRSIRENYISTMDSLKKLTLQHHCPIILLTQANREAAKEQRKVLNAEPEIDQVAESDAPAQYADKFASIRKTGDVFKIVVKKYRSGKDTIENEEPKIFLYWDLDIGMYREIKEDETIFSS
jgi:replicative DNA helicase